LLRSLRRPSQFLAQAVFSVEPEIRTAENVDQFIQKGFDCSKRSSRRLNPISRKISLVYAAAAIANERRSSALRTLLGGRPALARLPPLLPFLPAMIQCL